MTENENNSMIESPNASPCTFLDFPLINDLDSFQANVAILGIPFGMPYEPDSMANDQSRAPDAIRKFTKENWKDYSFNSFEQKLYRCDQKTFGR